MLSQRLQMPHRKRLLQDGDACRIVFFSELLNDKYVIIQKLNYLTGLYCARINNSMAVVEVDRHNLEYAGCEVCKAPGIHICSVCLEVRYCSANCQKSHWKIHKKVCNKPTVEIVANDSMGILVVKNNESPHAVPVTDDTVENVDNVYMDGELDCDVEGDFITFPVKLKDALPGGSGGFFLVYNANRSFLSYVRDNNPMYATLLQFLERIGNRTKIYMNCKYNSKSNTGEIHLCSANLLKSLAF